jgi:hypothetical protein
MCLRCRFLSALWATTTCPPARSRGDTAR